MKNNTLTNRENRLLKRYDSYRWGKRLFLLLAVLLFVALIGFSLSYESHAWKHDPETILKDMLLSIVFCLVLAYAFNARVQHCETLSRRQTENGDPNK